MIRTFQHRFIAALLICCFLTACGPRTVRDQAPFVQVTSWRMDGQMLSADVRIRNVNEEPMSIQGLKMSVDLGETPLINYDGTHVMEVSANGFESVQLEIQASEDGTALLYDLQSGKVASLPYTLNGRVVTESGREFPFDREGHIYTVPGRPGQFR